MRLLPILGYLVLAGCGGPDTHPIVGKWIDSDDRTIVDPRDQHFEYFADGTIVAVLPQTTLNGTWTDLGDGRIKTTITAGNRSQVSMSQVDGDVLVSTSNGKDARSERWDGTVSDTHLAGDSLVGTYGIDDPQASIQRIVLHENGIAAAKIRTRFGGTRSTADGTWYMKNPDELAIAFPRGMHNGVIELEGVGFVDGDDATLMLSSPQWELDAAYTRVTAQK